MEIQSELFDLKLNVIPNAMRPKIVIGKDILSAADIKITKDGLCVSIKICEGHKKKNSRDNNESAINELSTAAEEEPVSILQIETPKNELNVGNKKYEHMIQAMVDDYSPKISVKTPITTKIILTDEIPVYERA